MCPVCPVPVCHLKGRFFRNPVGNNVASGAGGGQAVCRLQELQLVQASGADEAGLISSDDTSKLDEAFARAAEIMNTVVGLRERCE